MVTVKTFSYRMRNTSSDIMPSLQPFTKGLETWSENSPVMALPSLRNGLSVTETPQFSSPTPLTTDEALTLVTEQATVRTVPSNTSSSVGAPAPLIGLLTVEFTVVVTGDTDTMSSFTVLLNRVPSVGWLAVGPARWCVPELAFEIVSFTGLSATGVADI